MRSVGVLAAVFALVVSSPAHAQASSASAPIASHPGSVETARKLVDVMHIEQTYERLFQPLSGLMATSLLPVFERDMSVPAAIREELDTSAGKVRVGKIIGEEFLKAMRARYGKMADATAKEYAAAFSEEELLAITAFYSSGVGAKALTLVPAISAKMQIYGQEVGKEAGAEAYAHILDRLNAGRGS